MISGKLALTIREVDVARVITSSVASVIPAAAGKQIAIEKVIEGKLTPIAADPVRLQQIFWNLLHNAIKFSPKGSRVEIKAVQIGSDLRITVNDWGCGIDPVFLPHVFERFWQADSHTTREHGGLGLGLSSCVIWSKRTVDLSR